MCSPDDRERPLLVLASASPRRRQLLALLGLPFAVQPADVEEANRAGESPAQMAVRLSQLKAHAVQAHAAHDVIVAADTLVYLDGKVLGKPCHPVEAAEMLRRLRGRPHQVFSGVTLLEPRSGWEQSALAETTVWMREYSDEEIAAYVASGDPMDKAGAYAIQHRDLSPVARVVGCYANVMGLPLCHLYRMLPQIQRAPHQTPVAACNRFNQRTCHVAQQILSEADQVAPQKPGFSEQPGY
jgi:septum formation protein